MIVAFSRSSRPIRPISWERLIIVPGSSSATISAARCSSSLLTGEKTEEIATDRISRLPISAATRRSSSGSSGEISRPSNSWPPCARNQWLPSAPRSRSGQSTIGGSACVADGVREVRRADHHRLDLRRLDAAARDQRAERRHDPARDVGRGGRLYLGEHAALVHQHRIRVRAADVDTDAHWTCLPRLRGSTGLGAGSRPRRSRRRRRASRRRDVRPPRAGAPASPRGSAPSRRGSAGRGGRREEA